MLHADGVHMSYEPPPRWLRPLVRVAAPAGRPVLNEVSMSARTGEVVGLMGPNGAGKTTLLKIVSTMLAPIRGTVTVAGIDAIARPRAARRRTGVLLAEDRGLYWRLTGRQNLEFFGRLAGMSRMAASARAEELLGRLGIRDDKLVFGYSSGMRVRLALARTLLTAPPLVILDEPTRSMDPLATAAFLVLVRQVAADGAAVVLSSHRLEEVAGVCDRLYVLVGGRMRFCGTPAELGGGDVREAALTRLLTDEPRLP